MFARFVSHPFAPQVRPHHTQPFSICDTCVRLKETSRFSTGEMKEAAEAALNKHIDYVQAARDRMTRRAEHAVASPQDVLYVNIDGMDQAKTNLPNEVTKSKADDEGMPLVAKLLGAIAYGHGWWGFWSFPEWSPSSNLTLTALCQMFRDITGGDPSASEVPALGAGLPPHLHLQMDNTSRDNKNHYLIGFAGMLVAERIFQEVRVFFLPVGHTHNEIDQTFSLVSQGLNCYGARCLEDLMEVAGGAWGDHKKIGSSRKVNTRLNRVLDFRRLLRYEGETTKRKGAGEGTSKNGEHDGPVQMHTFVGVGTKRDTKRYIGPLLPSLLQRTACTPVYFHMLGWPCLTPLLPGVVEASMPCALFYKTTLL